MGRGEGLPGEPSPPDDDNDASPWYEGGKVISGQKPVLSMDGQPSLWEGKACPTG